jgi:hypothetical protein
LRAAPFAAKQSPPSTEETAFLSLTASGLAALAQDRLLLPLLAETDSSIKRKEIHT